MCVFLIHRYGVHDVFEPKDLNESKNIPKVTRCICELSKLAHNDPDVKLVKMDA